MKRVINFLLAMVAGFLPAFFSISLSAQESEIPDWISPTYSNEWVYTYGGEEFEHTDQFCDWFWPNSGLDNRSNEQCYPQSENDTTAVMYLFTNYGNDGSGTWSGTFSLSKRVELKPKCEDPDYQIGVDSDGIDGIDQCHRSTCPASEYYWSTGSGVSAASGSICVQHPGQNGNGQMCKYDAIENTDGSLSPFTFQPAGEGCDCSSEATPCVDAIDGEVTNYPQGQNGCVQVADAVMCEADPEDHCQNGVCDSGCGYIGSIFTCIETNVTEEEARVCEANDARFSCNGIAEGECPTGVINCLGQEPPDNESPPAPCAENDVRPECAGVPVGDTPDASESGADSGDIADLGALLGGKIDQTNRNLKDIKDDTKKIADSLSEKFDPEEFHPSDSTDWSNTKALVEQYTSGSDVNVDQVNFEQTFATQEGFFNSQIAGLVPSGGGCSVQTITLSHGTVSIDACTYLGQIRVVIEWLLILGFILYVMNAFNRLKPNGA